MKPNYSKFSKKVQRLYPNLEVGDTFEMDGKTYKITDEPLSKVDEYLKHCEEILKKLED